MTPTMFFQRAMQVDMILYYYVYICTKLLTASCQYNLATFKDKGTNYNLKIQINDIVDMFSLRYCIL